MKVKKIVNITLETEEKETVKKFNLLLNDICKDIRHCHICPIQKQCNQIAQAINYLESL